MHFTYSHFIEEKKFAVEEKKFSEKFLNKYLLIDKKIDLFIQTVSNQLKPTAGCKLTTFASTCF